MRQRAGVVALTMALIFGLLGSATAYVYLNKHVSAAEPVTQDLLAPVVVATTDLTFGTKLDAEHLQTVYYPESSVPTGAYGDPDSLIGQTTKVFLAKREPILATKLTTIGGGLSIRIPNDMRATSMNVNVVSGVGGFVLPGDRVDVLVVVDRFDSARDAVTRTILQDVEVLAAGQKTDQQGGEPSKVQSVTLLVAPEGAEKLALALHEGKLHLVLRNPGDHRIADVKSISTSEILADKKPTPKATPTRRVKRNEPKKQTVTVIRGVDVDEQVPAVKEGKVK